MISAALLEILFQESIVLLWHDDPLSRENVFRYPVRIWK